MVAFKTLATLAFVASSYVMAMPAVDKLVERQLPPPIGPKPRVTFCRDLNWQGGCYVQDSDWNVCCMSPRLLSHTRSFHLLLAVLVNPDSSTLTMCKQTTSPPSGTTKPAPSKLSIPTRLIIVLGTSKYLARPLFIPNSSLCGQSFAFLTGGKQTRQLPRWYVHQPGGRQAE